MKKRWLAFICMLSMTFVLGACENAENVEDSSTVDTETVENVGSIGSTDVQTGNEDIQTAISDAASTEEVVPDHEHSYTSAVTKDPTCNELGETTYSCDCGDTYKEDIEMISHEESDWIVVTEVVGATNGLQHKVCTVCGVELATEEIYPVIVASGVLAEGNIEWKIIGTTLYVTGEGPIPDFDEGGKWFARCGNGYGNNYIKAWEMYYDVVDEIVLSEGITAIGRDNFAGFSKVTSLVFPSTLKRIGKYALNGMGLTTLEITENITDIDFNACGSLLNLTYVYIPGHIKKIPDSCFGGCQNLAKIEIEDGVTEIGENAFCILAWYDLDGVRHGGSAGFEIHVPESVTSIGDFAFATGDSYGPITVYGKAGSYVDQWIKTKNVQSEVTFVAQ